MSIAPTSLVTVALSTYSYSTDDPSASLDVVRVLRPRGGKGEGIWGGVYLSRVYRFSIWVKWATQSAHRKCYTNNGSRHTPTMSPLPLVPPGRDKHHYGHHTNNGIWLACYPHVCSDWLISPLWWVVYLLEEYPPYMSSSPPPSPCPKHSHHVEIAPEPRITIILS